MKVNGQAPNLTHANAATICAMALRAMGLEAKRGVDFRDGYDFLVNGKVRLAVRYAIPTANILWINAEIFSHWGLLTEVWVEPYQYLPEVSLICGAFAVMAALIVYAPKKPSETGERQGD